jgi:hypothetical protein
MQKENGLTGLLGDWVQSVISKCDLAPFAFILSILFSTNASALLNCQVAFPGINIYGNYASYEAAAADGLAKANEYWRPYTAGSACGEYDRYVNPVVSYPYWNAAVQACYPPVALQGAIHYGALGCSTALEVSLTGPNITHALPAGPALPQTARVTRDGVPEANKPVSISMSGSGALGSLSGTTDGNGEVRFSYIAPKTNTTQTALITATCSDCSNTAQNPITILPNPPPEICFGNPIDASAGTKLQFETDYTDTAPHALSLNRIYRSTLDSAPAGLAGC